MKVAVCGKGGSGKSALVTLLAKQARDRRIKVLVVDSDESNSSLFRMLGFEKPPVPLMELVGGKARLKEKMGQAAEMALIVESIWRTGSYATDISETAINLIATRKKIKKG